MDVLPSYVNCLSRLIVLIFNHNSGVSLVYFPCIRVVPLCVFSMNQLLIKKMLISISLEMDFPVFLFLFPIDFLSLFFCHLLNSGIFYLFEFWIWIPWVRSERIWENKGRIATFLVTEEQQLRVMGSLIFSASYIIPQQMCLDWIMICQKNFHSHKVWHFWEWEIYLSACNIECVLKAMIHAALTHLWFGIHLLLPRS